MKARSLFFVIPILGFSLISCTTTRPLMDDDVYVMQTPNLPLGEDLLDETAYSTYKYRIVADAPTQGYYDQRNRTTINSRPVMAIGSSWFAYGRYNNYGTLNGMNSPYWGAHRNGFYAIDGIPGFAGSPYGYYVTSFGYGSPVYSWSSWWNTPYSYYQNGALYSSVIPYGQNGGYYGGVYCPNTATNNSFFSNSNSSSSSLGYKVSGPRGTASGYYSGNNRGGTQQIKAQGNAVNSNSSRPSQYSNPGIRTSKPKYTRTDNTARSTQRYSNSRSASSGTRITTSSSSSRPSVSSGSSRPTQTRSSGSSSSSGTRSSGSSGSSSSGSKSSSRSGGRGN